MLHVLRKPHAQSYPRNKTRSQRQEKCTRRAAAQECRHRTHAVQVCRIGAEIGTRQRNLKRSNYQVHKKPECVAGPEVEDRVHRYACLVQHSLSEDRLQSLHLVPNPNTNACNHIEMAFGKRKVGPQLTEICKCDQLSSSQILKHLKSISNCADLGTLPQLKSLVVQLQRDQKNKFNKIKKPQQQKLTNKHFSLLQIS